MKYLILVLAVLGCGVATAAEVTARSETPPTLDHAILVFSRVDRAEVYLGESVDLTLEYWELKVRGLKAQPLYRGGGITLPPMEGFYAGPLQSETGDDVRDGANYTVTRHHQRLYPAVAGDLEIGPWRWQGSVRGYVASGPESKSVDLSTAPISVRVMPLPTPPSSFRGAVGEYEIGLEPSSAEMTQGQPASLMLEVKGSGNPATLEAPAIPEAAWYRLGDAKAEGEAATDSSTGKFTKKFRVELMPLKPGSFKMPSVSLTYFSPAARQYRSTQSEPFDVQVATSGPAESLVVIRGGSGPGGSTGLMEDGKLALAPAPTAFVLRRARPGLWNALVAVPPLLWLGLFLYGGGWRKLLAVRGGHRAGEGLAQQIAALPNHPEPVEGLRAIVRGVLTQSQGPASSGMEVRELVVSLEGQIGLEAATCIAVALQACEDHRYGKRPLGTTDIGELTRGLPEALAAVERCPRRGEVES